MKKISIFVFLVSSFFISLNAQTFKIDEVYQDFLTLTYSEAYSGSDTMVELGNGDNSITRFNSITNAIPTFLFNSSYKDKDGYTRGGQFVGEYVNGRWVWNFIYVEGQKYDLFGMDDAKVNRHIQNILGLYQELKANNLPVEEDMILFQKDYMSLPGQTASNFYEVEFAYQTYSYWVKRRIGMTTKGDNLVFKNHKASGVVLFPKNKELGVPILVEPIAGGYRVIVIGNPTLSATEEQVLKIFKNDCGL